MDPNRRRFDHFAIELSLALGVRVPRHPLWLAVAENLTSARALALFCGKPLDELLRSLGLAPMAERERARLQREVLRFDPARRTPEEVFSALFAGA